MASAHGVKEMARAHYIWKADCGSLARRCSGALLLLAIAGLLVACGGGGSEPAPGGGVSVFDGGGGSGVGGSGCITGPAPAILTWDAVTDPSLAGYRIYYGTRGGTYPWSVDVVGNVTTITVTGLSSGTTYYFAATAYDSSNPPNESAFSNEVCKTIS